VEEKANQSMGGTKGKKFEKKPGKTARGKKRELYSYLRGKSREKYSSLIRKREVGKGKKAPRHRSRGETLTLLGEKRGNYGQ